MTGRVSARNATARVGRGGGFIALLWLLLASQLHGEEVLVAVASNFSAPMAELAERFSRETGHDVVLTQGASGRFVAQISNGAPYQVFLSADQEKPAALSAQGLTVPDSRFTYALGALVLWSADPDLPVTGWETLQSDQVRRIALANPRLAPYGRAAVETLTSLSLLDATRPRWVQGENVAQAFQFVDSGNAQLGFVARSQVVSRGDAALARAWSIPGELHTPIRQDAVLLKAGADCQACRALLTYLRSPSAIDVIQRYGYQLP